MILALGLCTSIFILLYKSGWLPRAVGHQVVADILVTLSLVPLIGTETLGGLATVIWGGVFFSALLWFVSLFVEPEVYVWRQGWTKKEKKNPLSKRKKWSFRRTQEL